MRSRTGKASDSRHPAGRRRAGLPACRSAARNRTERIPLGSSTWFSRCPTGRPELASKASRLHLRWRPAPVASWSWAWSGTNDRAALIFCALLAADAAADACATPAAERAPDPRCGETLDGRAPEQPSVTRKLGHATLAVPRVAAQAALWPVVMRSTIDQLEYHHAIDWARALLTTDDGRVGVRPELQYSTSFTPSAGLRLF